MTPEELIEKHKKRIREFLPEEDREILDAYVSMRVKQENQKVKFLAKTIDSLGLIFFGTLGVALIICLGSLIGFGIMRDGRCTNYRAEQDSAVQTVRNEFYALKEESEKKISESQGLLQTCQEEQSKLQRVCIDNLLKSTE